MLRILAVADASADPFALTFTVPDIDLRDLHVNRVSTALRIWILLALG